MSALIYRKECEHGFTSSHWRPMNSDWDCAGGTEERLDLDRVVGFKQPYLPAQAVTVQDILDALERDATDA